MTKEKDVSDVGSTYPNPLDIFNELKSYDLPRIEALYKILTQELEKRKALLDQNLLPTVFTSYRVTPKDGSWANGQTTAVSHTELTRELLDQIKESMTRDVRVFIRHTNSNLAMMEEDFLRTTEYWAAADRDEIRDHWYKVVRPVILADEEHLKAAMMEQTGE